MKIAIMPKEQKNTIVKITVWLVCIPIVLFVLFALVVAGLGVYNMYHSHKVVSEFCGSIKVNDSLDSVLEKAKSNNISIQRGTEFYVKGFGMHYSSCNISQTNGTVTSTKFIPDNS